MDQNQTGATLFAACLVNQGVKQIFAIPGAKIDALFNALEDTDIELILCRHEQNAVFMAAAYGRLTGSPGVVLVTSGPGVSNLTTGLLTATTEGDPVIAIGGNVARSMRFKQSHQSADNAELLKQVTKSSIEILVPHNIPEVIENAFRLSMKPRSGGCFISLPQDVLNESTSVQPLDKTPTIFSEARNSLYLQSSVTAASSIVASKITEAKCPVLLLGEEASRYDVTEAVRSLLRHHEISCVGTYQAAGCISKELLHLFAGRVGLFRNQPGDELLSKSDLIITVGYNPVEYDPEVWHTDMTKPIIHIDYNPCDVHLTYMPVIECLGDIALNLKQIQAMLPKKSNLYNQSYIDAQRNKIKQELVLDKNASGPLIHPLRFIRELREAITDNTLVISDIGSHYMWLARYLWVYEPRRLLFSNGQQTLGVALPWAIGAHFMSMGSKSIDNIISISGDGGFLFSAMELETAVRVGANFTHFVWCDGSYNMVKEQQLMKYNRASAVDFGYVDITKFAESFGAHGFLLDKADNLGAILHEANSIKGPVLVEVPIDYSDNANLFKDLYEDVGH